jgi:dipeptidase D
MTADPAATALILDRFAELSRVPRPSKHEERVLAWLREWADRRGLAHASDRAGNLRVRVPAGAGAEAAPAVVLQAHVDMVCEKTPASTHDFMTDPIRLVREGEWLRADGTTLGADNGIAVAMMMAIAETPDLVRPPLELLFTVDEETGLNGARELDPSLVAGRCLINLDSEEEGVLIVGCAGGRTLHGTLSPGDRMPITNGMSMLRVTVGGLRGGHSGVDIHLGRANAIALLAEALKAVEGDLHLVALDGGSARNAIPRDAAATIAIPANAAERVIETIRESGEDFKRRFSRTDPGLTLAVEPVERAALKGGQGCLPAEMTRAILDLLPAIPHGVLATAAGNERLVETSNNLASVALTGDALTLIVSPRSVRAADLEQIAVRLESILAGYGARSEQIEAYPPWQPDFDSALLARCRSVHQELFGAEPRVELIHAGLECAHLGARIPGIDMISCGPTIVDPHSPSERVHVPSVGRIREFTAALLRALAG